VSENTAKKPAGFRLTNRHAFIGLAIALAVMLSVLIAVLISTLPDGALSPDASSVQAGVEPVMMLAGPGTGENPLFERPLGIAFGESGAIYVSDTGNNRICVFDDRGQFQFEFGGFGVAKPLQGIESTWDPGELNFPAGIDVGPDGKVYVADFRNDQVQVFTADGQFIRAFPDAQSSVGKGSSGQDGTGIAATDVEVAGDLVYVTDQYQVFVFTTEGEYVEQFGKPGSGEGDLDHPNGLAVAQDGTVYVADSNHNRVIAFDSEREVVWVLGGPQGMSNAASDAPLGLPRGLAVDAEGNILVVDTFEFSIVRVSPEGDVMDTFGERGTEAGQFNFPNDVDSQGDLLLVADKENDRVQVVRVVEE
jgi:tripartite motif-containing protein 71